MNLAEWNCLTIAIIKMALVKVDVLTGILGVFISALHRRWNGSILDSPRCPSVCPSVRPSVDKVSGTFWKKICSIHFIPGIYPDGVSLLMPIHFRVPSLIFGPLVAKYLAKNGVSGTFLKTIGPIHFIPGIYPSSFIFSPLVAKYLAENRVSGTFWKVIGQASRGNLLNVF